jgi:hypothetical protein
MWFLDCNNLLAAALADEVVLEVALVLANAEHGLLPVHAWGPAAR